MITYGKLIENAKKKVDLNNQEHRSIYLFLEENRWFVEEILQE